MSRKMNGEAREWSRILSNDDTTACHKRALIGIKWNFAFEEIVDDALKK